MYAEENLESAQSSPQPIVESAEEQHSTPINTADDGGDESSHKPASSIPPPPPSVDRKSSSSNTVDSLAKMLQMAKIKVNEAELAKQSSDIEQIVAGRLYDEKRAEVEYQEKTLRRSVEKSREYFEVKAQAFKELRFLFTKIEGLKSCLKEAKLAYQQSLKNLEIISTEIHTQRQQSISAASSTTTTTKAANTAATTTTNEKLLAPPPSTLNMVSNSSSTLSSSSSSISFHDQQQQQQNK